MANKSKPARKSKVVEYLQDSTEEIKKVTWPTKNQAIKMTILVLIVVLITALVIAVLDFVFGTGHKYLIDLAPSKPLPAVETTADTIPANGDNPISIDIGSDIPEGVTVTETPVEESNQ